MQSCVNHACLNSVILQNSRTSVIFKEKYLEFHYLKKKGDGWVVVVGGGGGVAFWRCQWCSEEKGGLSVT